MSSPSGGVGDYTPPAKDPAPTPAAPTSKTPAATAAPGDGRRGEGEQQRGQAEAAADLATERKAGPLALRDFINAADFFSSQASTNTRFLAAGGLAIVWALAGGKVAGLRHVDLSLAVLLLVAALGADFFHYAHATTRLGVAIERERGQCESLDSLVETKHGDLPGRVWFPFKMGLLAAAYIILTWAYAMRTLGLTPS